MACPADSELEDLLRGGASLESEASLAAHLESCAGCRRRLEQVAGGSGWTGGEKIVIEAPDASPELEETMSLLESTTPSPPEAVADEPLDFLAPAELSGSIGRLGGYDILERIGSGGMGLVLRAHDPSLNRVVAIKVLAPALARHALARARFIREARAAAAVVHDNVVSIHAVEELQGLPCIIMQFVKGRSLADRLRDSGPLRLEEILRIGAQTAHGLAAAHAQGLVHRDIKPGNILLENGIERAKLTDFGLARAVDDTELTRAGQMAGTPEYMSPEQARGEAVDQRTDLFSLGGVLYAMAAGKSPFGGGDTMAVLRRVCEEPPPLSRIAPALPAWFGGIVTGLMEKNPSARYQSAAEVAALLEERLRQCQRGEIPAASAPRRRRWMFPAGAAAAAALVFVLTRPDNPPPAPPPDKSLSSPVFALMQPDNTRAVFTSLQDAVNAAAAGATIEFTAAGRFDTALVQITGKPLRLRAAAGVLPVLYQPDPGAGLLSTDASLVLEGIAFERAPSPGSFAPRLPTAPALTNPGESVEEPPRPNRGPAAAKPSPLLLVRGGSLHATHCRFAVQNPASLDPRAGSAALRLEQCPAAIVRYCAIQALHASSLDCDTGGALHIEHSVFLGRDFLRAGSHPAESRRITVERCTVAALNFLTPQKVSRDDQPLSFTLRHSALDVNSVLTVPPKLLGEMDLKQSWQWSGEGNLYSVHARFVRIAPGRPDGVPSLDEWRTWWPAAESGSVETKLSFPDLPPQSESQTEFQAAHMKFTADGVPDVSAAGADTSLTGPGAAHDRARAEGELNAWDAEAAKLLAP